VKTSVCSCARCRAASPSSETGGSSGAPLHSPDYDFDDDILETGVRYYANLVRSFGPGPVEPGA